MKSFFTTILVALVWFAASSLRAAEADPYFPLEKGNYWVYRGETKWTQENKETRKNEVKKENLTWRMEVVDTVGRGYVFAAKIKGAPFDLSWYESGKKRGDYVIVRKGPKARKGTKSLISNSKPALTIATYGLRRESGSSGINTFIMGPSRRPISN